MGTYTANEELFLKFARIAVLDGKIGEKEQKLLDEETLRLAISDAIKNRIIQQAVEERDAK